MTPERQQPAMPARLKRNASGGGMPGEPAVRDGETGSAGRSRFTGGTNISLKVPSAQFTEMLRFYRDILRLPFWQRRDDRVVFDFGAFRLWLERAPTAERTEVQFEVVTDDLEQAQAYLETVGLAITETAPGVTAQSEGFPVTAPAGIAHWVTLKTE